MYPACILITSHCYLCRYMYPACIPHVSCFCLLKYVPLWIHSSPRYMYADQPMYFDINMYPEFQSDTKEAPKIHVF